MRTKQAHRGGRWRASSTASACCRGSAATRCCTWAPPCGPASTVTTSPMSHAYVLFVGHPRSGHSLVGSLLDAHPDIVVSHELDALQYVAVGYPASAAVHARARARRDQRRRRRKSWGYSYAVPGQWQGRFARLQVVGDKRGRLPRPRARPSARSCSTSAAGARSACRCRWCRSCAIRSTTSPPCRAAATSRWRSRSSCTSRCRATVDQIEARGGPGRGSTASTSRS